MKTFPRCSSEKVFSKTRDNDQHKHRFYPKFYKTSFSKKKTNGPKSSKN